MGKHDDIIDRQRPQYDDIHPMSRSDRAAQFSPFAALVGFGEAVKETERLTEDRRELTEEEVLILNDKLAEIAGRSEEQPLVTVTFFRADDRKSGGAEISKSGRIKRIDTYSNMLVFTDGTVVFLNDITDIREE